MMRLTCRSALQIRSGQFCKTHVGVLSLGRLPYRSMEAAGRSTMMHRIDGFTLVEIMIVVAVIAIVFAIGAPSFVQVVQKEPMRQAVSDVVEALGQARAQAILRGVPLDFRLTGEGVMEVIPADNMTPGAVLGDFDDPSVEREPGVSRALFSARLHHDVAMTLMEVNFRNQMDAEEVRVRFYPNGTCDDFTVVLEYRREMRRVWVDPITALADVETLR